MIGHHARRRPGYRDEIRNLAIFGGTEWDIGNSWTAGLELRWAKDEIDVATRANDAGGQVLDQYSKTFRSLTPRFTVSYNTDADLNYYLNIAKGVKPGDFNTDVPDLPDGSPDESYRAVAEETVWNYELGLKGQWWDRRLAAELAVYYLDIEDQQLTTLVELPDGETASIIQNVGRTAVYGFESAFQLLISEGLTVDASYAYTHAEIREHVSTDEADLAREQRQPCTPDYWVMCPEMMCRVFRSIWPLSWRGTNGRSRPGALWYLLGDYTYESSRYAQEHNLIETGDQSLVGCEPGWKAGNGKQTSG